MSTNYHTDIPSTGVAATAANINSPLGELDSAISQIVNGILPLTFLNLGADDPKTIATGAITPVKTYVSVDTEAAAATDNLDTISGGSEGLLLFVRSTDASRVVTLKHGTGNLQNRRDLDIVLSDPQTVVIYFHNGTNFLDISSLAANANPLVDYVDFNNAAGTPTHTTGRVWYDSSNKTLTVDMDGGVTRLQVGQENLFEGKNTTGLQIDNGIPVYVSGATGNRPTIGLAKADAESTSKLVGLATDDIANNADGWVANIGKVNDIDTTGTPYSEVWADGETVYVSAATAGYLTNVKPVSPNFVVQIGTISNSHATQGAILLDIQWFGKISDLADVNAAVPTDGQVLTWDNANSWWEPAAPVSVTTKGDIQGYGASPARVPVGADDSLLVADSSDAEGLSYKTVQEAIAGKMPAFEYTADEVSDYTTASTSFVDIDATNFKFSITTKGGPLLFGFSGSFTTIAAANIYLDIYNITDSTYISTFTATPDDGASGATASVGNFLTFGFVRMWPSLSAGTYEFRMRWKVNASTATLYAGAGTANGDIHPQFWITELA